MTTSDPHLAARFGERMRAALTTAIGDAFGGAAEAGALAAGEIDALIAGLGNGHHLHLELEVAAGRHEGFILVFVLHPADGERLFELEPTDPALLGDPITQLKVLGEFTEAAEALSVALAGALASTGSIVALRVSGASLEEADASLAAALAPLGADELVAYRIVLNRPPGEPIPLVVAASIDLAALLCATPERPDSGVTAAERAANLAARVAARRAPITEGAPAVPGVPSSAPSGPGMMAHPFAFGQLDTGGPSPRNDRGVDLILDVALQVRVELGSTRMTVEDVLALSPGSVVELDRLAGEPVDIVINDRLIARGEVVVVEENFGVRVTEIISARNRAAALG